jgi:molybdopterin molybdotransferase
VRTGITPAEALEIVLGHARPLGAETLPAPEALGRVAAEAVVATRRLPPLDNSAMDGYALRAADARGAAPGRPALLPLAFEVAAGDATLRELPGGSAARIFTGAPLPPGADAVVRQEDVEPAGREAPGSLDHEDVVRVGFVAAVRRGDNVRPAGEDVRAGEVVLEAGTRLGPAALGMLASLGRSHVAVHQRPRVAILSGGDELVEPDGDPSGGRIVASNSYSLAAQCREVGAEPVYLGIARDRPEELERRLRAGLASHVIVSSAGVSVGDRDYVRPVLEKLGCELVFWGVAIKPGYPLVFGRFGARSPLEASGSGSLVFGLPGNPVSAMVTFEEFVRPLLRKLAGHRTWFRPRIEARLGERLRKPAGRMHLVRVRLERRDGRVVATPTGNQSSGVLRSMALAHGLLVFSAEATELAEGAAVQVQVLDEDFLAAPDAGL